MRAHRLGPILGLLLLLGLLAACAEEEPAAAPVEDTTVQVLGDDLDGVAVDIRQAPG